MKEQIIKFRVWDKGNKRMGEVNRISFPIPRLKGHHKDIRVCYLPKKSGCISWTLLGGDYELMQYTGLTDCKGKEIFDGDIVEIGLKTKGENPKYEIKWSNLRAGWMCLRAGEVKEINILPTEVIGNIYENKELLK